MTAPLKIVEPGGPLTKALEQARATGKREPCDESAQWARAYPKGQWGRDPQAEAIEAIHQTAEPPLAQPLAESHDKVAWTILLREQMRRSPCGKHGEYASEPRTQLVHGNHGSPIHDRHG